jgi:hypothetical protein
MNIKSQPHPSPSRVRRDETKGETKAGSGFPFRGPKGLAAVHLCVVAILLWLLSSCEKDFNINANGAGNEMAINSLFNDGSPVVVFLTKPYAVTADTSNITAIPGAQIQLYEDSIFKEVMHYVPSDTQNAFGSYVSNYLPKPGKTYTIKATAVNYTQATASDQIPVPAELISSSLQQYIDTGANQQGIMTMVFKDNPAVQNYYRINVWISGNQISINRQGDTTYTFQNFAMMTYPISLVNDTVRDGDFFLFSDRGFNGQEKALQISFGTINPYGFSNLTLYVELHTVSYAHYEYFQTLNLYRTTSNSAEPVFIYSNVNGGYGDFVAEHIQSIPFVIK